MKHVNRRTFYQTRMKADGTEYKLYSYEVIDELGNKEVIDSLQEFEKGDRVETWFCEQYNKVKMRPYKAVRNITVDKG
jgi:hypothetical protein